MRQKLAKPSNQSIVSRANRQGNNNGKLFPVYSRFFKPKKEIDKEFSKNQNTFKKDQVNNSDNKKNESNDEITIG